jgi:hypothetical protein
VIDVPTGCGAGTDDVIDGVDTAAPNCNAPAAATANSVIHRDVQPTGAVADLRGQLVFNETLPTPSCCSSALLLQSVNIACPHRTSFLITPSSITPGRQ